MCQGNRKGLPLPYVIRNNSARVHEIGGQGNRKGLPLPFVIRNNSARVHEIGARATARDCPYPTRHGRLDIGSFLLLPYYLE
ncbi:MAG: hypothetical protein WCD86_25185 [Ktedonobacteraceae bacterium]